MSEEKKPLPFLYQFAAGAVAGVSEVRVSPSVLLVTVLFSLVYVVTNRALDPCHVRLPLPLAISWLLQLLTSWTRYPLDVVKTRV